jgi:hypothetical protein
MMIVSRPGVKRSHAITWLIIVFFFFNFITLFTANLEWPIPEPKRSN